MHGRPRIQSISDLAVYLTPQVGRLHVTIVSLRQHHRQLVLCTFSKTFLTLCSRIP